VPTRDVLRAAPIVAAALILLAWPASGQLAAEAEEPRAKPPWEHVSEALVRLDQSLIQQFDGRLWGDVRDTLAAGRTATLEARDAGADLGLCLAIERTLAGVTRRQDLLEREAFAWDRASGVHPEDADAAATWVDAEYGAVSDGLNTLADELRFAEGRIPQTTYLMVEVLFEQQRDAEAEDALSRGLSLWPTDPGLHDQARAWAEVLPSPEHLVNQLENRVDVLDVTGADFSGIALETVSVLQAAMGKTRYANREFGLAGLHFDRSAKALQRAGTMPRQWSRDELDFREADALVNAAYSYQGLALDLWAEDRNDDTAKLAAEACEQALTDALRAVPGHQAASDAVLWLGERLMNKGDPMNATYGDIAQMRDFYGRMAERFNKADWWNNYAFWCRETATTSEGRGDADEAWRLFEASYGAYQRTIALAPDNARYVNDTGLILLYHLHRDLDVAEELFERAWELGREVCENPFVEQEVYDFNFEAYCDAMLNLSRLHLERQQYDRADEVMAQLVELAPDRPDVQMTSAELKSLRPDGGNG
jgi:tetratricopeptide (TPR) repeat protein